MACAGCERRREWLKKWAAIAKERARLALDRSEKKDLNDVK